MQVNFYKLYFGKETIYKNNVLRVLFLKYMNIKNTQYIIFNLRKYKIMVWGMICSNPDLKMFTIGKNIIIILKTWITDMLKF